MQTVHRGSIRVKLVFFRTLFSQSVASVSMGSLAAYLRLSGFQTDLCLLDRRNIHDTEIILGDSPQNNVVIAKPNFKDFGTMLPLLERLKSVGVVSRVFLCGPFAKLNYAGLMSELPWLDGVFIDQLEVSANQLLSTMSNDLSSWNLLSPGGVSRNPRTGIVGTHTPLMSPVPLSTLPFPARDIEAVEDVGFVNIEASRGCLFDCSFCHIPLISETSVHGFALNVRDPVLVVDEIEWLNRELGKTLFIFNDSCFWSTKKDDARILLFCKEIERRKLDVHFYVYLKGKPFIGDEVLHALVKAGLVRVFLGVENSVKSSLALYRKKIRPDLYEAVRAKLDPLGVNVHIGYITIEPYSSLDDVLSNVEYLFRIGKLFRLGVILEPVRIVPGTRLYQRLVVDGLMPSGLRYHKLTYGYKFAHEEVGHLLGGWKEMLEGHLKDVAYGFEYHSTTGEILRVLAERLDPEFASLLKDRYETFNAKRLSAMSLLLDYFRASIEFARIGKVDMVRDVEIHRQFVDGFTRAAEELAILYGGIVATVKQNGGERAVKEIYPG